MRKTLFFIATVSFLAIKSLATIHTVNVGDNFFSPSSLTMPVGDTIKWVLTGSNTHTTTSTSVPSGAATWDHTLNSSSTTFTYKATVAGNYTYQCSIHGVSMSGAVTVTSSTNVPAAVSNSGIAVYPNPVSSDLHLQFANAAPTNVVLIDILGSTVYTAQFNSNETLLDLQNLPNGRYIANITHGDVSYKHELLIAH